MMIVVPLIYACTYMAFPSSVVGAVMPVKES